MAHNDSAIPTYQREETVMQRLLMAVLLLSGGAGVWAQTGTLTTAAPVPILPDSLQWGGAATGAQNAWLVGAADQSGLYVQRVRMPAGAQIAPHTHVDQRASVVLEGTIYVGFGEVIDESTVVAIPQGAMYIAPAGVPHYVLAKDGPALYQETGVGPTGTTFLNRP
jgi:quercetin dioxygenase-like cupin family protein